MNIWIIKTCDVKLDGTVKTLQDGTLLDLPDDKAQRLIDAGYAGKYTHSGDGRDLSHFCFDGDCHCSAKFPGAGFRQDVLSAITTTLHWMFHKPQTKCRAYKPLHRGG